MSASSTINNGSGMAAAESWRDGEMALAKAKISQNGKHNVAKNRKKAKKAWRQTHEISA